MEAVRVLQEHAIVTFALDISHHQPSTLDFAQARREGCELVIIKAGEGDSFVDPAFAANLAKGRAAGMLTSAYWYLRSGASAQAHADEVSRVVPPGVPVIPDVEDGSGGVTFVQDVVNRVRAAGYPVPLTYLPRWYWQQLGSPSLAGLPPLWSSRYPDTTIGSLPDEWADVPASYWDGYGGLDVALLQFTSSARIAGYAPLDANAFRGTREQLAALLGQGAAPNNDEETTMLVPPGTNDHIVLPCAGRPLFWYLYAAFGHNVTVHQCAYVMPTQYTTPDPVYAGGGWNDDHVFDTDRPGPVEIPRDGAGNQPVGVVLRYTADHAFTAYVG